MGGNVRLRQRRNKRGTSHSTISRTSSKQGSKTKENGNTRSSIRQPEVITVNTGSTASAGSSVSSLEVPQDTDQTFDPVLALKKSRVFFKMGNMVYLKKDYTSAQKYYQKALELRREIELEPDFDRSAFAVIHDKLGDVHNQIADLEAAEEHYEKALYYLRDSTVLDSSSSRAVTRRRSGKWKFPRRVSKRLSKRSSKKSSKGSVASHEELVKSVMTKLEAVRHRVKSRGSLEKDSKNFFNMGSLYLSNKNYSDARTYFERALSARKELNPNDHLRIAAVHEKLGDVSRELDDIDASYDHYDTALDLLEKVSDDKEQHSSQSQNDQPVINMHGKNCQGSDEKEEMTERIKASLETLPPRKKIKTTTKAVVSAPASPAAEISAPTSSSPSHLSTKSKDKLDKDSKNLFNMGSLYLSSKNYPKAREFLERSLQVRNELYGLNHPSHVMVHEKLGDVSRETNEISDAIIHYDMALAILQNPQNQPTESGKKKPVVGLSVKAQGKTQASEENEEVIERIKEKVDELRDEEEIVVSPSPTSSNVDTPTESLHSPRPPPSNFKPTDDDYKQGISNLNRGNNIKAKLCFEKSCNTNVAEFGKNHVVVALVEEKLGDASSCSGNFDEAIKYYNNALEKLRRQLGNDDDTVRRVLTSLGHAYQKTGNVALAAKFLQMARAEKRIKRLSAEEPKDSDYKQGVVKLSAKHYARAEICFEKSYQTNVSKFGTDSVAVALIEEKRGDVCSMMRKHDQAVVHYNAALGNLRKTFGDEDEAVERISLSCANAYQNAKQHLMAAMYYEMVLPSKTKKLGENHVDVICLVLNASREHEEVAKKAKATRAYDDALKHYHVSMSLLRRYWNVESSNQPQSEILEETFVRIAKLTGNLYSELGHYDAALKAFDELLQVRAGKDGSEYRTLPDDKKAKTAIILHNMGILYERMGFGAKAMEHYRKSLDIKIEVYGNDNVKIAKTINCMGFIHFVSGDDDEALRCFREAARLWKQHPSAMDVQEYMCTLNDMALIYSRIGRMDDAAKCIEEKIKLSEQSDIAETFHKMACSHLSSGKYDKAIECYKKALKALETNGGSGKDIAFILRNLGTCYGAVRMYPLALASYRDSLQASGDLEKALVLSRMGFLHDTRNEYEEALQCYDEALHIESLQKGNEHDDVAVPILNNIGSIYFSTGDDNTAMEFYNKALESSSNTMHSSREKVFKALCNMGILHQNNPRDDVDGTSSKTRPIVDCNDSEENIAIIYNNIGNVYSKRGVHRLAATAYEKSLRLKKKILGGDNEEIVGTLINLGSANFYIGAHEGALECYRIALKIMENLPRSNKSSSLKVAAILNKMGNVYSATKDYSTAMTNYLKALKLRKDLFGDENHAEILLTRHNIGLLLCKEQRFDEAMKLLQDVYHRKKKMLGDGHPEVTKLLLDMGSVHLAKKEYREAKELCDTALKLFEDIDMPRSHPYMRQVRYDLRRIRNSIR